MSTRKGGKKMKRTTSVGRKVKRLRGHFRWKNTLSAEELDREFRAGDAWDNTLMDGLADPDTQEGT